MSRADDIAQLLIETGHDWSAREIALHLFCTINSVQSAMTKVRKLCVLEETITPAKRAHRPEMRYRARVEQSKGLLQMNRPRAKPEPAVVHSPND